MLAIFIGFKIRKNGKSFVLDWKMPIDLRKIWPVIVNAKGEIIYIPRYRYAYRIKPQDNFIVKSKLGI